ncbi:MAG: DUF4272 domain-containing protein [Clostridiales bacterium]|nr:DUF4272 domain-containing protein [Clostridiales bacterium]
MSFFKRLFGRNKNVIELTAEELSEPVRQAEPEPQPVPQPEPIKNFTLDGAVFFAAASLDEARMTVRLSLRNSTKGFTESEDAFDVNFTEAINASATLGEFEHSQASGIKMSERETQAFSGFRYALKLAFLSHDDQELESSVRELLISLNTDLHGLCVLNWESVCLFEEKEPESAGTPENTTEKPAKADGSRSKSLAALSAHAINQPVNAKEGQLGPENYPRNETDVLKRVAGLLFSALTALAAPLPGQTLPAGRFSQLLTRLSNKYAVKDSLTVKEAEYVKHPGQEGRASMCLKSEAAALLLWYLGLWELPWADTPSETVELAGTLSPAGIEETLSRARLRSRSEIEDMYDLTICQHWLSVRMSLNELRNNPLDPDIVYARHYALNWLMRVGGKKKWDSVVPTT